MKRIIDISEEDYNYMMECCPDLSDLMNIYEQLKNSTPLNECDDCISRKYLAESIKARYCTRDAKDFVAFIEKYPSVYPKNNKSIGKWKFNNAVFGEWTCSNCNMDSNEQFDFCPNCGAKMESEDNND